MGAGFKPNIKVCGIGGGGGNAVNTLISKNIPGVEYVVCNTDIQALGYVAVGSETAWFSFFVDRFFLFVF